MKVKAQLYPTLCNPMDVACQAPLSMEFSRQEYWSGLPFSSPGDLPDPGIEPRSPALQADYCLSYRKTFLNIIICLLIYRASQIALVIKNLSASA